MASMDGQAQVEAYLAVAPEQTDLAAMQRAALEDVLRLTAGSAGPVLAWIEDQYRAQKEDLQDRLQMQVKGLEGQFLPARQRAQQVYQAKLEALKTDHDRRKAALDDRLRQGHAQLVQNADQRRSVIDQRHADRVMEADFLIEGALDKAKQSQRMVQQATQKVQQALDQIRAQAEGLVVNRGLEPPAWPAQGKVLQGARPAGQYHRYLAEAMDLLRQLKGPWYAKVLSGISPRAWQAQVLARYQAFQMAWLSAKEALEHRSRQALERLQSRYGRMIESAKAARRKADLVHQQAHAQIKKDLDAALAALQRHHQDALHALEAQYQQSSGQIQVRQEEELARLDQQYKQQLEQVQSEHARQLSQLEAQYSERLQAVRARWVSAASRVAAYERAVTALDARAIAPLVQVCGEQWRPASRMPSAVRLGTWALDKAAIAGPVLDYLKDRLPPCELAAILRVPGACSLLVEHDRDGRDQAIELLRAVMVRLFVAIPPGQVRLTLVDPIGLGQSFAGFMHASDYHQAVVGGRIWTEAMEIQRQLEEITDHMENVIQKYLRNEFETIEQYNLQAGQLAEPYRFLVIADFPAQINEESARRLSSIVHSGPRCGVHTLVAWDSRFQPPEVIDVKDLASAGLYLLYKDGRFACQDPVLRHFAIVPDKPPDEQILTRIMRTVGKASLDASRVEVPFDSIAPNQEQIWSLDSTEGLSVPIGRTGAASLQYLQLGKGLAQHMLIAGKTGSGKSTLLHVIITSLGLWYGPEQVELYLIDFKKGVEFKTYVTHRLPHAKAIAVESDREFGLSILQRLLAEMDRRGEVFRQKGVQDIAAYRTATGRPLPRVVLIVDEFQVFFAEDDKLAQDAALGLEQLVRQGRAFGIHVILGSQTLGGAFGLARSTMGQMAVRIALQCSEADSQLILDDENVAARRLSRPGEAIYNDSGGRVTGNSPFQVAWLPEEVRDRYLAQISKLAGSARRQMVVFEGNAPAAVADNNVLEAFLHQGPRSDPTEGIRLWLGSPVAIKEPTAAILRRQAGANLLIVGQREDLAVNLMVCGMIGASAQLATKDLTHIVLDGGSSGVGRSRPLRQVVEILGSQAKIVGFKQVPKAIADLARTCQERADSDRHQRGSILVWIYGLQRYSMLRKTEDAFGLVASEQDQDRPDVQFRQLLRTGPAVGIHLIVWADTLATVDRTIDRQTMREFDWRVLFQMGAADSSNLIDSPIANQLGLHRAILYSQEQGTIEKFRPYAIIDDDWLKKAAALLAGRAKKG